MAEAPVVVLRRWEASGASWRVVGRSATGLQIALVTCTGDEEVDRWWSDDPELRAYVGDRSGSGPGAGTA